METPTKRQKGKEKVENVFRSAEKKYRKYKNRETDFSDVLDFSDLEKNSIENKELIEEVDKDIFKIRGVDGFFFLRNAIPTKEEQLKLASECLYTYPNPPHVTNLTMFHGSLSDLFLKASKDYGGSKVTKSNSKNKKKQKKTVDGQSSSVEEAEEKNWPSLLHQLRWVTLGYHYDWTERKYQPHLSFPFPEEVKLVTERLAQSVGYKQFKAEAAIVNYYHLDSTLCGHIDDAELTLDQPIVSISLGPSAIFLLGGKTREERPVAMYVRSGDVVIMGGESRCCYHGTSSSLSLEGVPRIIEGTSPDGFQPSNERESAVVKYLVHSRINVNVRQVKLPDQKWDLKESKEKLANE